MRDERFIGRDYYVHSDSLFYEPLDQWYVPETHFVKIVEDCLSAHQVRNNWILRRSGLWFYAEPKGVALPPQGWKIHVSSRPERAEHVLAAVVNILIPRAVPFKFALDGNIYDFMLDKWWPRGSSGKFITIYPPTFDSFCTLLRILYEVLRDEEGPYILSDRRYKDCRVLYYRYGGFVPMNILTITGESQPIIKSPEGEPILDRRLPYFSLPDWLSDPFQERGGEAISSSSSQIVLNGRYRIERALHFSNTGGVYLAEDMTTGTKVVVKEARPYVGHDSFGNDAVSLRKKEWEIMHLLADTSLVPRPLDLFYEWEHCFLVATYEEGRDLREILLRENPLVKVNPSAADSEKYYDIYRRLFLSLCNALEVVHNREVVLGDLSASNLLVNDDYAVRFIDLEAAFRIGIDKPCGLYTHGFRNRQHVIRGEQSFKDDLYTMGVMMAYMLFPVNAMVDLRKDVYRGLVRRIVKDMDWPSRIAILIGNLVAGKASYDDIKAVLQRKWRVRPPQLLGKVTEDELERIVKRMEQFILRSMRDDNDYLWPGDPFMFVTNPLSLCCGAIGVLYSLKKCGCDIPGRAWRYLDAKLNTVKTSDYPPGLLTGMAGIAWGAWELGCEETAERLMQETNSHPLVRAHHSLFYGMAGVGLANLFFYLKTAKDTFLNFAVSLANELVAHAKREERGLFWKDSEGRVWLGYGYGQTGVALFLLRLSQITGDQRYRDLGRYALGYDLSYSKEIESGVVSFPNKPNGATLVPYVEEGTAGIVKVLLRYGMVKEAERLSADMWRKYSISASYLFGLAGIVDAFVDLYLWTGDYKYLQLAQRPLSGIKDIYLIRTNKGLAVPGDGGLRISCDWGTGVAGVMRVLHRYITKGKADFMLDELDQKGECGVT